MAHQRRYGFHISAVYQQIGRIKVAQTVRELHRDPSMAGILERLEAYAQAYFEKDGHQIAVN